jgi:hypothetical protein
MLGEIDLAVARSLATRARTNHCSGEMPGTWLSRKRARCVRSSRLAPCSRKARGVIEERGPVARGGRAGLAGARRHGPTRSDS